MATDLHSLNHKGTVELQTERLLLRRFTLGDAGDMFANWASDPEVARFMRWDAHQDAGETKEILQGWIKRYESPDTYYWAVILKDYGRPVGTICLYVDSEYDSVGGVAYCLGRQWWGQGITAEALERILRFGLLEVGLNRIEAFHSVRNPGSGRVMQKAGMKYEGRSRQKYRSHDGYEDCDLYAILKEDL
jgi:ribosomal-protein-alanine N-acetyltransferase